MKHFEKMTKKQLLSIVREVVNSCDSEIIDQPSLIHKEMITKVHEWKQENFVVSYLDSSNKVIETRLIFLGTLNSCLVSPREVFAPAIELRAASIIIGHNHPSGNIKPSGEDLNLTDRLKKAGDILGVKLLDSLVFKPNGYYSFKGEQLLD